MLKLQLKLFLLLTQVVLSTSAVDLIVFSYNRPMQLYALLESCELYLTGRTSSTVIYRVSGQDYQSGYDLVRARFSEVNFVKQENPPHDFRGLVQKYAFELAQSNYIMFAVDDLFVKAPVDLQECVNLLERFRAYTFSLRLSPDINYCYAMKKHTPAPKIHLIAPNVYRYIFCDGQGDWAYPNSVDMHLFRKNDVYNNMFACNWNCPSLLEGSWAARADLKQAGLCFNESKAINIPLNLVQDLIPNHAMHSHQPAELLTRFMQGQKINLEPIAKFKNNSVHANFDVNFIAR